MRALSSFLSSLFALALLAAMGMGLYYLFVWIVGNFRGFDLQQAPILTAAFFALVLLALLVRWSRNQDSEMRLRMEKAEVYLRFLSAWSSVLQNPEIDRSAEGELKICEQELLLWGNSAMLRAYLPIRKLRGMPRTKAESGAIEKVIKSIRMDLRQQTIGLNKGDLIDLLLSGDDIATATRSEPTTILTRGAPRSLDGSN